MRHRLGKLPARHDPRTYKAASVLAAALPVIPLEANWARDAAWPVWGNDRYGCCTQASVASAIRTWTGAAQAPVLLSDADVLDNYSARTGFNPATGLPDNGDVELDVLQDWCTKGYERPGQTRDYLTGYGSVSPHDMQGVQRAIAFLGGLYIGLSLPAWACAIGCGDWDYNQARDNTPIGGHAVWIHGYDSDWLYLNTWGEPKRMSWSFFLVFCDEAYALVSRQNWTGISGVSPNKEDLDVLVAEMQASINA